MLLITILLSQALALLPASPEHLHPPPSACSPAAPAGPRRVSVRLLVGRPGRLFPPFLPNQGHTSRDREGQLAALALNDDWAAASREARVGEYLLSVGIPLGAATTTLALFIGLMCMTSNESRPDWPTRQGKCVQGASGAAIVGGVVSLTSLVGGLILTVDGHRTMGAIEAREYGFEF